jgi:outer membrane beta-barrel protein
MESEDQSQGFWHSILAPEVKNWGIKFLIILTSIFWLSLVGLAWNEASAAADDSLEAESAAGNSDEYNFNWLDPDKKIYVLQNRKYLKAGHPVLSLMAGTSGSNPYRSQMNLDGRFSYYMSELFGVELFYLNSTSSQNSTMTALQTASPNALPSVREISSQVGGMLHFVPWYAKINVFNSILYFDWYFGAGVGTLSTNVITSGAGNATTSTPQSLTGFYLSTGHQYFLSQSFILRLDFTGAFYNTFVNGTSGDMTWFSNLNFALGLGLRI